MIDATHGSNANKTLNLETIASKWNLEYLYLASTLLDTFLDQIGDMQQTLSQQERQINQLVELSIIYENKIGDLYNSTSWRLTRPLRFVGNLLKTVNNKVNIARTIKKPETNNRAPQKNR